MTQAENFRNFLTLNGAYEAYCRNLNKQSGCTFEDVTSNGGLRGIIDSTLMWANTPERDNFWSDLNRKWNYALDTGKIFDAGYRSIW